jgi:hypothetical protein
MYLFLRQTVKHHSGCGPAICISAVISNVVTKLRYGRPNHVAALAMHSALTHNFVFLRRHSVTPKRNFALYKVNLKWDSTCLEHSLSQIPWDFFSESRGSAEHSLRNADIGNSRDVSTHVTNIWLKKEKFFHTSSIIDTAILFSLWGRERLYRLRSIALDVLWPLSKSSNSFDQRNSLFVLPTYVLAHNAVFLNQIRSWLAFN